MNPLSIFVIPYNRISYLVSERKRVRVLDKTIETIRENHKNAKNERMEHYERIYNVSLYVLIFDYDFTILKSDALFSVRKWKKNFVARQMAVQLYEASKDLPELLGRKFRLSLGEIGVTDDELREFNSIHKRLSAFKNEHKEVLHDLRNYAGAHRDNDAALQLEIIEKVELLGVMKIAGDFYEPIRDLIPYMMKIVLKMRDPKVLIRHIRFDDTSK